MRPLAPIMAKGAASTLPLDLILDAIPSLPRPLLSRMVQKMIDRLDQMDGDPDLEPGDDDHSGGEDDFCRAVQDGPGCPIADSDMDDVGEDDQADCEPSPVMPMPETRQ